MARIVYGLGASHSPMLTLEGKRWSERAADDMRNPSLNTSDGRFVSYEELARENGAPYGSVATEERFLQVERASQRALDRLAGEIEASAPDVVVIVGDDQQELFSAANMPAVSIYYGERVVMHPFEINERSPSWLGAVTKGYAMDAAHEFAGHPELALDLIRGLIERDVDVGVSARIDDPGKAGFGHAYGFIVERLFKGRAIPVVPVLLNTYYPPNQITARRCYDIGRALRASIEASVLDLQSRRCGQRRPEPFRRGRRPGPRGSRRPARKRRAGAAQNPAGGAQLRLFGDSQLDHGGGSGRRIEARLVRISPGAPHPGWDWNGRRVRVLELNQKRLTDCREEHVHATNHVSL